MLFSSGVFLGVSVEKAVLCAAAAAGAWLHGCMEAAPGGSLPLHPLASARTHRGKAATLVAARKKA